MTTMIRDPREIVTLECTSANVAEGALVVLTGSGYQVKCGLPAAADTLSPAMGLALRAGSTSTGKPLDVVTHGIYPGIAAASITRGDPLVAADTSGGLKPLPGSPTAGESIIGEALATVNSGERVPVRINPRQQGK